MKYLKYLSIISFLFLIGCSNEKTVYLYPKKEEHPKIFLQNLKLEMDKQLKELYSNNFEKKVIATNEMELGKRTLNYYSFRIIKYEKVNENDLLSVAFENPIVYYNIDQKKNKTKQKTNKLSEDYFNNFLEISKVENIYKHTKLYYKKQRKIKAKKLINEISLKKEIFKAEKKKQNYEKYIITVVGDNLNSNKIKIKKNEKLLIYFDKDNNIKIMKVGSDYSRMYLVKKLFTYYFFYFKKDYVIIKNRNNEVKKIKMKKKETLIDIDDLVIIIKRI